MPGDGRRGLGEQALRWTLGQVRHDALGPWAPEHVPPDSDEAAADRDSLYAGTAGLAMLLAEAAQSRPWSDDEAGLADSIRRRLETASAETVEPCLYDGLAGYAVPLRLLGSADRTALERLAAAARPEGWRTTMGGYGEVFHAVVLGTAGIVMAALASPGPASDAVVEAGCAALAAAAEPAPGGRRWPMSPGHAVDTPNFSHGTAGTAAALALAGAAHGRDDWLALAMEGASHLMTLADLAAGGFRLPMRIPYKEGYEHYAYSWCHGPTGTQYLFAALDRAGAGPVDGLAPTELRARCIASVLASGVPERTHPGFWDNDGLCCGTAGVGMMLLDAAQDADDPGEGARLLAAAGAMAVALADRAVVDDEGARGRFVEHRAEEPRLRPSPSWMQGSAGIAAFLLRLDRVERDGLAAPVVRRPDAWWAVPEGLLV